MEELALHERLRNIRERAREECGSTEQDFHTTITNTPKLAQREFTAIESRIRCTSYGATADEDYVAKAHFEYHAYMSIQPSIRLARPGDEEEIVRLVRELASFEHALDSVHLTPQLVTTALFDRPQSAAALVAENNDELVALALWYQTFSTWTGHCGMHLEDLYVSPRWRRGGLGRRLMEELATICVENDLHRLELNVLAWNESAISFYRALNASPLKQWETWRLDGSALHNLMR